MRLRGFGPSLVAIAAGGLAIRVAYTLALGRHVPGSGDYEYYHGLANLLADGKGFVHPLILGYTGVSVPTAEHPPLWPLLLSVSSSLGAKSYVAHRNVVGIIVEKDAGTPDEMDALRKSAGKPTLPVWFVAFGKGKAWADKTAEAAAKFKNMGVTCSTKGEYKDAADVLVPVASA